MCAECKAEKADVGVAEQNGRGDVGEFKRKLSVLRPEVIAIAKKARAAIALAKKELLGSNGKQGANSTA